MTPPELLNKAVAHHRAGRLADARRLYYQILLTNPKEPDALHLLGVIAGQEDQLNVALDFISRAIALRPNAGEYHLNLSGIYQRQKKLRKAAASFLHATDLVPGRADAGIPLIDLLRNDRQLELALAVATRITQCRPDAAGAHNALGVILTETRRMTEAEAAYRRAIQLDPSFARAYENLGTTLHQQDKFTEAMACYQKSLYLDPTLANSLAKLATIYFDQGAHDRAIEEYRKALTIEPNNAGVHWNLSLVHLTRGEFAIGWDEFEWRLKYSPLDLNRNFPQPQWDGTDVSGKTLLVHTEGGFGDALHFARYIPMLRQTPAANAAIFIECQPELVPLFADFPGVDRILHRGDPLPPFDVQIPFQSLPRIFRTDLKNLPHSVPYLRIPPNYLARWKNRVPHDGKLNVGLSWAGSAGISGSGRRSRTLAIFAPLARAANIRFVSLQKGPEAIEPSPSGMDVLDFSDELHDFADTAALMEQLDLIISVDTSVAHLAGALAKPVWVLIPFIPDFRWLLDREDSPWYPTMRLFRQTTRGDWTAPVQKMAEELCQLSTRNNP